MSDKGAMLDTNSPNHLSVWRHDQPYSGLDKTIFTSRQLKLISELIAKNKWIEEESQNLLELLQYNSNLPGFEPGLLEGDT